MDFEPILLFFEVLSLRNMLDKHFKTSSEILFAVLPTSTTPTSHEWTELSCARSRSTNLQSNCRTITEISPEPTRNNKISQSRVS